MMILGWIDPEALGKLSAMIVFFPIALVFIIRLQKKMQGKPPHDED